MRNELQGLKVAALVENGFEQAELAEPKKALEEAGAQVDVISPQKEKVKGWNKTDWGGEVPVDVPLDHANAGDYDALLLPGGVMNPDKLRINDRAVRFVRSFFDDGKPVAAICHGPWTLINAGVARGRRMTSYWSLEADLRNAGAEWIDESVVTDNGLVTSRYPNDLPDFNRKMIEEFGEGRHTKPLAEAREFSGSASR
jgi:protease I